MNRARVIAAVLSWGTWLSAAICATGLVLHDARVVMVGIAAIISLPFARVAIMLAAFTRERDKTAALIAALVLMLLVAGFLLGLAGPGAER